MTAETMPRVDKSKGKVYVSALRKVAVAAAPPAEVVAELDTRWPLDKALANAGWMDAGRTLNALPQPEPDAEWDLRVCAFCGNDKGGPFCPHTPSHPVFDTTPGRVLNTAGESVQSRRPARDRTLAEIIRESPVNAGLAR
jgi:hypothetical protein